MKRLTDSVSSVPAGLASRASGVTAMCDGISTATSDPNASMIVVLAGTTSWQAPC